MNQPVKSYISNFARSTFFYHAELVDYSIIHGKNATIATIKNLIFYAKLELFLNYSGLN